jgi:LEA14-like dessication related protein
MSNLLRASLVALVAFAGCPGAQVKDGGGGGGSVEVVLRRVDVVKAGYDQMIVNVIVAVENGTADDVDVSADVDLALVGPAVVEDAEAEDDAEEEEGKVPDEDDAADVASGLDGARHKGSGGGRAVAYNTSELPIQVTLPLPSDPAVLEQVLSWKKAKVHIKGKVKVGFTEQTIAGERDMATPQLPELRLESAQIAKVDGGTAGEAFFKLLLDNKNPFEVNVDRVTWKISITDKELRSKDGGSTSVPPSAVEEYNETVPLTEKDFPAKELKAMLTAPSVPYSITGQVEVRGIVKDVEFKGEMQFPR